MGSANWPGGVLLAPIGSGGLGCPSRTAERESTFRQGKEASLVPKILPPHVCSASPTAFYLPVVASLQEARPERGPKDVMSFSSAIRVALEALFIHKGR